MFKCNFTLLLGFLKILNVLSTEDTLETSTSTSSTPYNILPLTLIDSGNSLKNPSKLGAWTSVGGKFLNAVKQFSAESQENQIFLCGMGKNDYSETNTSGDLHCTYPTKFDDSEELRCKHEPELVIRTVKARGGEVTLNEVTCGKRKNGKMYQVVYKICMTNNPIDNGLSLSDFFNSKGNVVKHRSLFEIFRFCYDKKQKIVLHTEHKIFSPALLIAPSLKNERRKTYTMTLDTNNIFNLSEQRVSENFKILLQDPTHPFTAQQLVPSNDFAFASWRKATFLYFNSMHMRKELIELWDYISDKIRENAIELNREYYIQTSVTQLHPIQNKESTSEQAQPEVLKQQPQSVQVGKKRSFPEDVLEQTKPIAKQLRREDIISDSDDNVVWSKIIYHIFGEPQGFDNMKEINAVAIVMANNFNNNPKVVVGLERICKKNLCENFFTKRFEFGRFIRCCSVITNPTLLENDADDINFINVSGDLKVDFLKDNDTGDNRGPLDEEEKMKE